MSAHYSTLTQNQRYDRLEELDKLYWNAMSYMAAIAVERGLLMNEIQQANIPQEPDYEQ